MEIVDRALSFAGLIFGFLGLVFVAFLIVVVNGTHGGKR